DKSSPEKIAGWYSKKSITPPHLWYGAYHVEEPAAKLLALSYEALGIPKDHTYPLKLPVREGKKAHSEGITNIAYKPEWIQLLGSGAP
ncbi:MAG TPA: hypothetical protein VNX68_02395, partial [Nitrosopumilaceae archaeon]|nr:hypothetical protein [Nitrosopumilaceae archaeon]